MRRPLRPVQYHHTKKRTRSPIRSLAKRRVRKRVTRARIAISPRRSIGVKSDVQKSVPTAVVRSCVVTSSDGPRERGRTPKGSRAKSGRSDTGLHAGQLDCRVFGVAALLSWDDDQSDPLGFRVPRQNDDQRGRAGQVVAPSERRFGGLVRTNRKRRENISRASRRRNRLAIQRKDALALVFCKSRYDVLHDRPVAWQPCSAIREFFTEMYDGVLVTDFWSAYNSIACADRQMCLVRLLRELKKVDKYLDTSEDWAAFRKRLKRLVQDAIRLWQRHEEYSPEKYASLQKRIEARLQKLIADDWANKNAKRLVKRLRKYELVN